MLHSQQKVGGTPMRPDTVTPQRITAGDARPPTTRQYESPALLKENSEFSRMSRQRERASPLRTALQDVQMNQYDSVMANSRLEEIRRKYDSQQKRFHESHTPLRENSNMLKKKDDSSYMGSGNKLSSISQNNWEGRDVGRTTESIMGSASKQKEGDLLAEQVRQIRKSFRADEERGRSASRASSIFTSELPPSFGRAGPFLEDPRVESIDKINLKIKQILNCLNENEKQIGDGAVMPTSRYCQPNQPAEQMNRDRDVGKQLPSRDTRSSYMAPPKPEIKISESFISANGQQEMRQSFIGKPPIPEKKEDSRRHSMYTQKPESRIERAQSVIPMKSSMMMGKRVETSSSIAKTNGEYILSSGKDLDEEIRKIQEKIKRSEEEKRRLDIKFEIRYQELNGGKVVPVTIPPKDSAKDAPKNFEVIDIPKLSGQRSAIRKNLAASEESPSFKQLPVCREDATGSNSKNSEVLRSVLSRDRLTTPSQGHHAGSIASITRFSLGKESATLRRDYSEAAMTNSTHNQSTTTTVSETTKHYGYRRPFPEVPKTIPVDLKTEQEANPVETKRLVDGLRQQVAYDEELRNSKLNFAALQDPSKWAKLGQQLAKLNINLSEAQLKAQFELSLEEHNPFYSVRETQESPDSVAKKYAASYDFWNRKIKGGFDRGLLQREMFKQDRVDLERKGYLTVEDFVRFLNIETGTFYRNRDLILIFRRLGSDTKLSFDAFLKVVCR